MRPVVLAIVTSLLPLAAPGSAYADMLRPWTTEPGPGDGVTLKSCSGQTEAAPFGGGSFAPCIDVYCDPAVGLYISMALTTDGDPRDWPASIYAESRDKGRFTFHIRPETGMFPSAIVPPDVLRPILEDLAGSVAMTVIFADQPYADLATLRGYPMDGAAAAIPDFLSSCPLLNGGAVAPDAPSLPSFTVEEPPAPETPEPAAPTLPSFSFTEEVAQQPPASAPAEAAPALPSFTVEGTAPPDPSQAPPGVIPGMPLSFAPDPAAPPATPSDDATRFVTVALAALPDQTAETLIPALMAAQQIDFAARYGGVPVIAGDLVIFADGRLIVSAVFCVDGKTGDQGCETWTMATPGGGAPFAVSTRGLPSDRPLWIDLKGPGTDGWPDLLMQDAAGAWTRFVWTGAGYF